MLAQSRRLTLGVNSEVHGVGGRRLWYALQNEVGRRATSEKLPNRESFVAAMTGIWFDHHLHAAIARLVCDANFEL